MEIILQQGSVINLSKDFPNLKKIGLGLGWDLRHYKGQFDLDASAFMLNSKGKIPADEFFIFYNNLLSPDGSVEHQGDHRTGVKEGDDEVITVSFNRARTDIFEVLFVVTIHDAAERNQSFVQVKNAYIRLFDYEKKETIAKYNLTEDHANETGIEFGRLSLKNGEWIFSAVGKGYRNGLQDFVDQYV